jgi:hypothetical protein
MGLGQVLLHFLSAARSWSWNASWEGFWERRAWAGIRLTIFVDNMQAQGRKGKGIWTEPGARGTLGDERDEKDGDQGA